MPGLPAAELIAEARPLSVLSVLSMLTEKLAWPSAQSGRRRSCLQEQDRILRSFPEVATRVRLHRPLRQRDRQCSARHVRHDRHAQAARTWPAGMTYEKLIQEMDAKLQFPGLTNTWTMPVENRLDMELTGIKTPVGIKIQGPDLDGIQELGSESSADSRRDAGDEVGLCRARRAGILRQCGSEPGGSGALWIDRRRCAARDHLRNRRREHRREYRGPRTLSHRRPLCARFPGRHSKSSSGW